MSLASSNRLRYYYEHILRYDLLLKLNYKNIMQVPQISKVNILASVEPSNNAKNISLALEIICGQKAAIAANRRPMGPISSNHTRKNLPRAMRRSNQHRLPGAKQAQSTGDRRRISTSQSNDLLLFCSLRGQTMYNFLEKLITILTASYDYKIRIQGQEVQITLSNRELRLFPEIQNHFEFFECFQNVQVTLVTSASNEKETQLLWTGLQQKEI